MYTVSLTIINYKLTDNLFIYFNFIYNPQAKVKTKKPIVRPL